MIFKKQNLTKEKKKFPKKLISFENTSLLLNIHKNLIEPRDAFVT